MYHGLLDKFKVAIKDSIINYYTDKRILITGASSGVGEQLCIYFLEQGAFVVMVGREKNIHKLH